MYEPVLVVSNGGHRCLAVPAVPVDSVTGEARLADSVQLSFERGWHICCIAEGQLVASEQQGMHYC